MDSSLALATARRGYQVAPAGCGKTHLIAETVSKHSSGRELILTHTHAGVDVLRRRLKEAVAAPNTFELETIAGWALRYAISFPRTSGVTNPEPESQKEWRHIYIGCAALLELDPIKEIVRSSYCGVFVDEYQDCSVEQHNLIRKLADVLPCRVLGDPLQGIFGFNQTPMVNWKTHIEAEFTELPALTIPWRWNNAGHPNLGKWLTGIRADLMSGNGVTLSNSPNEVIWVKQTSVPTQQHQQRLEVLKEAAKKTGTVVAIMKWEAECNKLVNNLHYLYSNIEVVACDALMTAALQFETTNGVQRMAKVVEFACDCFVGLRAEVKTITDVLKAQKASQSRLYTRQVEMDLLKAVLSTTSLDPILPALDGLSRVPKVRVWRRELFYEMLRALKEFHTGDYPSLKAAAWAVRNKTRHAGRKLGQRVVSRTLLVKGLEFDHCVLLDADALEMKDLYVALTRGAQSVTIVSKSNVISPKTSC